MRCARRAAVLLVMAMTLARPAGACKCAPPPAACEARDQAGAVFVGMLIDVQKVAYGYKLVFLVERSWKGFSKPIVFVWDGGKCPYDSAPSVGRRHLIYAGGVPGELSVGMCTRSRALIPPWDPLDPGDADLPDLGLPAILIGEAPRP